MAAVDFPPPALGVQAIVQKRFQIRLVSAESDELDWWDGAPSAKGSCRRVARGGVWLGAQCDESLAEPSFEWRSGFAGRGRGSERQSRAGAGEY
jgi:hypothetical protein